VLKRGGQDEFGRDRGATLAANADGRRARRERRRGSASAGAGMGAGMGGMGLGFAGFAQAPRADDNEEVYSTDEESDAEVRRGTLWESIQAHIHMNFKIPRR
jgi:hypothetical protein